MVAYNIECPLNIILRKIATLRRLGFLGWVGILGLRKVWGRVCICGLLSIGRQ